MCIFAPIPAYSSFFFGKHTFFILFHLLASAIASAEWLIIIWYPEAGPGRFIAIIPSFLSWANFLFQITNFNISMYDIVELNSKLLADLKEIARSLDIKKSGFLQKARPHI